MVSIIQSTYTALRIAFLKNPSFRILWQCLVEHLWSYWNIPKMLTLCVILLFTNITNSTLQRHGLLLVGVKLLQGRFFLGIHQGQEEHGKD